MADEITITNLIQVNKDELFFSRQKTVSIDMSGDDLSHNTQLFTTTASALSIAAGVTTAGVAFFNNCNSSGSIDIGTVTGGTFAGTIRLKAGECGATRVSTLSLYAQAVTGTVRLEHAIAED